jgi:hypothetical protein
MEKRFTVGPIQAQTLPPEATRQAAISAPDGLVRRAVTAMHRAVARRVLRGEKSELG